ncbi:MAG TPA: 3'-5' exonuclease, partial [Acidimicrobiales bacterium]
AGAMDFDDLLLNTVSLFRRHPDVLAQYQRRFTQILVDEYQDTNHVQNDLVLLLGADHRNVFVVGDSDQCLPPGTLVQTPDGEVPIEQVGVGATVVGAGGDGHTHHGEVSFVKEGHYAGPVVEVRAGGRVLRGTPHHLVLGSSALPAGDHLVYLMWRADRGYRVGRTGQELADKLWLLRACDSDADAEHWAQRFADAYSLPISEVGELDTEIGAKHLMSDLLLHPDFPHGRPNNSGRRQSLNLTMFSDRRTGVGYHRVQWSSNRADIAARLVEAGVSVRPGRLPGTHRFETSRSSYPEAVALARSVAHAGGLDIRRRAQIGPTTYDFLPLSHLHVGMRMLVPGAEGFEEVEVEAVTVDEYDGPVYDLEVARTHTYVANGLLVHNSIYNFRGADIRNILEFEDAFPDVSVFVLEQNYRSTQTILDAANAVIANNMGRKPKELWTDQGEGQAIVRYHADDEGDEAQWIAHQINHLHDTTPNRWGDVAVFYRTNAQSRVLEEALFRGGVPYKVIGGTRFYDRREVKDALAYLKAVVNPSDEVSIKRVINVPKRGVGDTTVGRLDAWARAHGVPFIDALRRADDAGVTGRAVRGIESFVSLLDELTAMVADGPAPLLEAAMERSGYVAELRAEHSVEADGRIENLAELVGVAHEFESVDEFLEQVSLVADT